jgi:hypothetical protein
LDSLHLLFFNPSHSQQRALLLQQLEQQSQQAQSYCDMLKNACMNNSQTALVNNTSIVSSFVVEQNEPFVGVGVVAKKLIVVDKLTLASKAKLVYVAKDAAVTKGTGTDTTDISATFDVAYDAEAGAFAVPAGALVGNTGWKVNKPTVAKFVNKDAPAGGTEVKVAVIKPSKLLKLVAKGLGDGDALDIVTAGAPTGSVFTSYCVTNGTETTCHCTEFPSCSYKLIAGDTGAKLVCKTPNAGNPACTALP